jgi:hypothetical protein
MLPYREALAQAMAMQRFPGAGVLGSAQTMRCNSKSTGTVYAQKPSVTRASTISEFGVNVGPSTRWSTPLSWFLWLEQPPPRPVPGRSHAASSDLIATTRLSSPGNTLQCAIISPRLLRRDPRVPARLSPCPRILRTWLTGFGRDAARHTYTPASANSYDFTFSRPQNCQHRAFFPSVILPARWLASYTSLLKQQPPTLHTTRNASYKPHANHRPHARRRSRF